MSLFGNQNTGGSGAGGLFGNNNNNNQNTGGGGLFGSNTNQTGNTGGGLFGASTTQPSSTGGGLFGSSAAQTGGAGGGLFGSNTTQNKPATGGLFGASTNQASNNTGGGLFGSSTAQNNNQTNTGGGLFGATTTQNNQSNTGGGLFGAGNANNSTGGGLFGSSTTLGGNQNASNAQNQATNSAFNSTSLFGAQGQPTMNNTNSQQPQQGQQSQQQLGSSVYNPQTVSVGNFGHTFTNAQLQKLQLSGLSTVPNEKKVAEQIKTVFDKWNPQNAPNTPVTTVFKTYLYNAVPKEYAPFFYPNTTDGEDERSWEEALSQKPDPPKVDGHEASNIAYVPILCKGFKALGDRVETQAKILQEMRSRLHEMNNSLTAVMSTHEQKITVRIQSARRQHQLLSQRCLRLAVKVQVLRNRGYALDPAEENLRKTLIGLEKQVMDPGFVGREDEIWARMVALRERAKWLETEGKRLRGEVDTQQRQASTNTGVPEEVLAKTRKILKDYDGQLKHLSKELEDVKTEYEEWEQRKP